MAVGLRGDAHQVGHRSACVLGHEDSGGDRGEGVGLTDDLHHLQAAIFGSAAGSTRAFTSFIVEALDDALGILQILTGTRDHDAVGLAVEGD